MLYITHAVFSLVVGILCRPFFSLEPWIFYPAILLFGLLPDIDESRSVLGRRLRPVGWIFRHRGIFHSALFGMMASSGAYILNKELGALLFIGYLSHLALDALNRQGVMPLYPLSRSRIRGFIRTGGLAEQAILFTMSAAVVLLLI